LDDNRGFIESRLVMTETHIEPIAPESIIESVAPPPAAAIESKSATAHRKDRFAAVAPVLEKLFELYPQLFGQHFVPLKLGVFQDLLAAHPETFQRESLKAALGVHTRSTRYLQCVASGMKRHDLLAQPVDDVAPEHVFLSIVELFHRRQARTQEDLKPKLARQLAVVYQASGLSRPEYLARLPALQEPVSQLLDDAIADVDQQRAKDAALIRAFDASGKSVEEFAESLGMAVQRIRAALKHRP
jgi:ProP effector